MPFTRTHLALYIGHRADEEIEQINAALAEAPTELAPALEQAKLHAVQRKRLAGTFAVDGSNPPTFPEHGHPTTVEGLCDAVLIMLVQAYRHRDDFDKAWHTDESPNLEWMLHVDLS